MTPENTRVRFTRTSLYVSRECWACIRARRKRPSTEAERAAKRAYARARRDGTYVPKRAPVIGAEERAVLSARHDARIAEVGYDWARKRKSKAARGREARLERERRIAQEIACEESAQLQAATSNPDLAALIEEQKRDARTFSLPRSWRFVPQDWAERLFYGDSDRSMNLRWDGAV